MSEPFLSEIQMFGFGFAPRGWATCDGQLLPISQNQALFSILGTIYGGDGRTTFALPELRGRVPIHKGTGTGLSTRTLGSKGGQENHMLTPAEMPSHTHTLMGSHTNATDNDAAGNLPAISEPDVYAPSGAASGMNSSAIASASGGGQSHTNMQPFLAVFFCIALQGVFPSRN